MQKSFGRLAYNDFRRKTNEVYKSEELLQFAGLNLEDTYGDRVLEKAFVTFTKKAFEEKVVPTLECAKNMGNIYCGSLYAGIASLLCSVESADLQGKRVLCFSYGSGLAASMFSLTVCDSTSRIAKSLNIPARLNSRTQIAPGDYDQIMGLREQTHNMRDYAPVSAVDDNNLFPGTFYLDKVDEQFRRNYIRHE